MKSSFFVVADRGNLRAFRAEKVAADRPPRLQQVQSLSFADGHTKISEMNTDTAGRHSAGGSNSQSGSISEKHYDIELDKRISRRLADSIAGLLKDERPVAWSFAAPEGIKNAVVNHLPTEWQKNLAESLPRDLVNVPTADLLGHFSAAHGV